MQEKLSARSQMSIMLIVLSGTTMAISGNSSAESYSWLSALLAGVFGIIMIAIYEKTSSKFPTLDFFLLQKKLYGKFIGTLINLMYFAIGIFIASTTLGIITSFLTTVSPSQNNKYLIAFCIILIVLLLLVVNIDVKGRYCEIIYYFVVLMTILPVIMSLDKLDLASLFEFKDLSFQKLLLGSFEILSVSFIDIFFAVAIMTSFCEKNSPNPKIIGTFKATILITLVFLRNISLLGFPLVSNFYYPSYEAVGLLSLGSFWSRQEVLVSATFLLCDIVKTAIILSFCKKAIDDIFTKKADGFLLSLGFCLLILALSLTLFGGSIDSFRVLTSFKYFIFIPFAILPILGFLISLTKKVK